MTFPLSITFFASIVFLSALLMNIGRKNTTLITIYVIQSLAVAGALLFLARQAGATGLLYAALLTLIVKAVMAPTFFWRLVRTYSAHFSAASYLSTPLSLAALAVITTFSYSYVFASIRAFQGSSSVPLLMASILSTLFLMINRRGALSQVVGILALENAIVLLTASLGAEHSFALEFAISFDIAAWIAIAAGFLAMIYQQFGTIEVAIQSMTHLTEE